MFRTAAAGTFFAAWQALRTGKSIPHYRTAFQHLPADIIPHLLVLEWAPGERYIIRFLGTARVKDWGEEATGRDSLTLMPEAMVPAARQNLRSILDRPCGVHQIGRYASFAGREFETENIILPVANDPGLPPRIIHFAAVLAIVGYDQPTELVKSVFARNWIDIGFGVPNRSPAKS